ncbi:MAG: hypothetical protein ACOCX2_00010 [Armatimonadota bacterium]
MATIITRHDLAGTDGAPLTLEPGAAPHRVELGAIGPVGAHELAVAAGRSVSARLPACATGCPDPSTSILPKAGNSSMNSIPSKPWTRTACLVIRLCLAGIPMGLGLNVFSRSQPSWMSRSRFGVSMCRWPAAAIDLEPQPIQTESTKWKLRRAQMDATLVSRSSMSMYKVGMIDLGHFARQFIPLFKAHPLVGEVVLCELRKDVLDELAKQHEIDGEAP